MTLLYITDSWVLEHHAAQFRDAFTRMHNDELFEQSPAGLRTFRDKSLFAILSCQVQDEAESLFNSVETSLFDDGLFSQDSGYTEDPVPRPTKVRNLYTTFLQMLINIKHG